LTFVLPIAEHLQPQQIPLLAGLAVRNALEEVSGIHSIQLKWPNDVLADGAGALGGAFWGLLFGLLFFVPLLGMAIGAAAGALSGSLTDVGINDDFIKKTRDQITPGTSALFVMSRDAVLDKVKAAFPGERLELLFTNLSDEQEKALREAFAE